MEGAHRAATLPAEPTSAAAARHFVSGALADWSLPEEDVAVLLVSELVTNAVLHARSPVDVHVRLAGDALRVEVHDGNPLPPQRKHYSALAATGRGLGLIEVLSARWGVDGVEQGKVVWFEIDLDDAGSGEGR